MSHLDSDWRTELSHHFDDDARLLGKVDLDNGGVKKFRFLETAYLVLCARKISARSDEFEFWRVFPDPPRRLGGLGRVDDVIEPCGVRELLPHRQAYLVPSFSQI